VAIPAHFVANARRLEAMSMLDAVIHSFRLKP
jgi:hypothetical protein